MSEGKQANKNNGKKCHLPQTRSVWTQGYPNPSISLWHHQPLLGTNPAGGRAAPRASPRILRLAWAQVHFLRIKCFNTVFDIYFGKRKLLPEERSAPIFLRAILTKISLDPDIYLLLDPKIHIYIPMCIVKDRLTSY